MPSRPNKKTSQLKWNLSPLFASDDDPDIKRNLAETEKQVLSFVTKWQDRQDYLSQSSVLLQALTEYDNLNKRFGTSGNVGYYFHLRLAQDENNSEIKAHYNKAEEFSRKLLNHIQFFELRIGKVTPQKQVKFLANPKLQPFHHFLRKLFERSKYLLTEPEEKILNLKEIPAHSSWTKMTSAFLAKETRRGKNLPQLISDFRSDNKRVRDRAAVDVSFILEKHQYVAENELNAILGNKKIDDQLRGIYRPDLSRHLADDIDSEVVDAMTNAVSTRFDISARYYQFKAKTLGVSKLKYHERFVPFGKVEQKYTFFQSLELVSRVFNQLDPQFEEILNKYVKNGQVDVFPRVGKRGGAFCAGDLIIHPTYILLNHTDHLNDVLTLAHEMGHGINNELMKSQKHALNFGSPLSIAEVASTFIEDFVLQQLLSQSTSRQRLVLYMQKLDDDMSTIFRQVAAYNFEKELHLLFREKGYLASEEIGKLFIKHMASYMGQYVEQSEGSDNYWVYWSHFRSFFYVYSYASGLLISKSLKARVKQDPKFIKQVKQILSAGSSDSPKNIFQKYAGIDISNPQFWTKGLDEIESLLVETEKLYKEVKGK